MFPDFRTCLGALALSAVTLSAHAEYPERDLQGVIMWGAGGATDNVARAITPLVEPALGAEIVLVNRPGGTGAIATNFVYAQPADGYTLLYGAENPQLHKILGLSQIDYAEFFPVNILARGVAVIVANNDTPWESFEELVADAQSRPGEIKMGATGPGGLPHVVGSMLQTVTDFQVTAVPFDGEGPGLTALQGGHVDFMPAGLSAAGELIRAGRVRVLAVVNTEELEALPGVAPITESFPDFERYLPWGPFYGIFVKEGTPEAARDTLVAAFDTAASDPGFVELMENNGNIMMNIAGDEAVEFLNQWQSVTSWILHEAGASKASPEDFGIPRP